MPERKLASSHILAREHSHGASLPAPSDLGAHGPSVRVTTSLGTHVAFLRRKRTPRVSSTLFVCPLVVGSGWALPLCHCGESCDIGQPSAVGQGPVWGHAGQLPLCLRPVFSASGALHAFATVFTSCGHGGALWPSRCLVLSRLQSQRTS